MKKANDDKRLFEVMARLDKTFKPRLNESEYTITDPTKEEMVNFLTQKFHGLVDPAETDANSFDVAAAIYWFANDYHGGQSSNLYSALSTSEYRPGPMHKSIEDDESETATMMYQELVDKYGGGVSENIHNTPMMGGVLNSKGTAGYDPDASNRTYKDNLKYNNSRNQNIQGTTVKDPIIPDAIDAIQANPDAVQFNDKQSYDDFANQQQYFSASHSHSFYSPEEMEQWRKSGNVHSDPDAEQSDMVFDTGHELVQVWDNKNQRGYVVPSKRKKDGLQEKDDNWIQKAVDPAHKGDCTPMTKDTCTPRRKALAKRFKAGIEDESVEEGVEYPAPEEYRGKVEKLKQTIDNLFNEEDYEVIDTLFRLLVNRERNVGAIAEGADAFSTGHNVYKDVMTLINHQGGDDIWANGAESALKFYEKVLEGIRDALYQDLADSVNPNAGAAPDEME